MTFLIFVVLKTWFIWHFFKATVFFTTVYLSQIQLHFWICVWCSANISRDVSVVRRVNGGSCEGCSIHECSAQSILTSTMSRLLSPRHKGKIHVESGEVRSGNHRAPPVVRPHCPAAQHTISCEAQTAQQSMRAHQADPDSGYAKPERGWSTEAAEPKLAGLPWMGDSCPWCRAARPDDAGASGTGTWNQIKVRWNTVPPHNLKY